MLLWQAAAAFAGPLDHWHYETFVLSNPMLQSPQAVFRTAASGEVTMLHVLGMVGMEFNKVRAKP